MKLLVPSITLCLGLVFANGANAALVSALGGQVVNDTDLNITWLANANLAATNTFGVSGINSNGLMTWSTAQSWIAAMNATNYLGYQDWRLPSSDTCSVYNCTGSEMGHLFYTELGGVAGTSIATTHNANYGLFSNLLSGLSDGYWSGTDYAPNATNAWTFYFTYGYQNAYPKNDIFYALAVRTGQVSTVPEPAAAWLFGPGLFCLIGVARRRLSLQWLG